MKADERLFPRPAAEIVKAPARRGGQTTASVRAHGRTMQAFKRRPPHCNRPTENHGPQAETPISILDVVLVIVGYRPGVTDDQLAFAIFGRRKGDLVSLECNHLAELGDLQRRARKDGLIGNYRTHAVS